MAIKYYGSCSGNAGAKYNVWLEVTENSQSVENNVSKLSVTLKLKRNDGFSGSAYNLNENENFAKITLNEKTKVSKNLKIDTRNNVTVTLLNWSGEVPHNADGTLTINISGEFSMSGTSLAGGSASGNFKCVTIPRSSSFTLSKLSVTPEEEITLNINSSSSSFSHTLILELGDFKNSTQISTNVNEHVFSIPKEWANALPKSKSGTINVTLKTYNNKSLVGSAKTQLNFKIPETADFQPEFFINVKDNKNGVVPGNWSAIIQNKSTITVRVHTILTKFGATFSSGYIIVGNIKKYGTEAEFELPESGNVEIIGHIEDSRGFIKETKTLVNVSAYSHPTINCNTLIRCDSSGAVLENGSSALIDFTPVYSSVLGLNYCRCYVKYKSSNETSYSEPVLLTQTPFVLNGNFKTNLSYDFVIYIKDAVSPTTFEIARTLPSGYVSFNIRKGGKGAAFGCYSENENELTIGYNLNVKGQIASENLNNLASSGAGFSISKIDVKNYSCLSFITLKAELVALNNINTGTFVDLLVLSNFTETFNAPLNVVTGNYNIDKNIKCFIDTSGVIKLITDVAITTGTKIYINGII